MSPTLGAHPAVGLHSALKTQTQVALPLLPVETGLTDPASAGCSGSVSRPAPPFPCTGAAAALRACGTGAGGRVDICCSHVELDYCEVNFLSLQNSGVFDISDHSISTLGTRNHTGPVVWNSFGEKKL